MPQPQRYHPRSLWLPLATKISDESGQGPVNSSPEATRQPWFPTPAFSTRTSTACALAVRYPNPFMPDTPQRINRYPQSCNPLVSRWLLRFHPAQARNKLKHRWHWLVTAHLIGG
ncbi:MAG: hypothetical protein ACLUB2_08295 [Butyricicoccus pullicaecorum]